MAQHFGGKGSPVPGICLFLMLWILSLALLTPAFLDFRRTGYLELAGGRWEGAEAVAGVAILALIPITMLALAIQRIHRFSRQRRQNDRPGE